MKLALTLITTGTLLASTASALASPQEAHVLYPRDSLARAFLSPDWGKGSFGGEVSYIPASEAGIEFDSTVTVTSTLTITVTRGKKDKRAMPTGVAKRSSEVEVEEHVHIHGHGHKHGHHHHHHHHHEEPAPEETKEEVKLTPAEEARYLNDAFSLEMFKIGGNCNIYFGNAVCIDNKVAICGTKSAEWEVVNVCGDRRRCGAGVKEDGKGVKVACLNITELEYPEYRPSQQLHDSLRK